MFSSYARVYVPGEFRVNYADTLVMVGEYSLADLAEVMALNRGYREGAGPFFYNPFRPAGAQ